MNFDRTTSVKNMSSIYNTLALINRLLLMTSAWNVLISFIEANFWHFTEPTALGLKLVPAFGLFFAFFLPGFFFISGRIWNFRLQLGLQLMFAMVEPILLLISALPALDELPSFRTCALGFGTFLLPFVVRFCRPTYNIQVGCEFFLVIFVSMCVRWSSHAVNVFYEEWRVATFIICVSVIISVIQVIMNNVMDVNKMIRERQSRDEVLTTTEMITETPPNEMITHTVTNSDHTQDITDKEREGSINLYPMMLPPSEGSDDTESCSTKTDDKPSTSKCSHSLVIIFMTPGISSFLMFFIQFFSSPAQLARWAGLRANPFGIFVVFCCTISFLFILMRSCQLGAFFKSMTDVKKVCGGGLGAKESNGDGDYINSWNIFWSIFPSLLCIILLVIGCVLLLNNEKTMGAVTGLCMICLSLPYVFVHVIDVYVQSSSQAHVSIRAISHISGSLIFFVLLTALTSFNLPTLTNIFFGRMSLILATMVVCICLAVIVASMVTVKNNATSERRSPLSRYHHHHQSRFRFVDLSSSVGGEVATFVAVIVCTLVITSAVSYRSSTVLSCREPTEDQIAGNYDSNANNSTILRAMSWNILLGHTYTGRDNSACIAQVLRHFGPSVVGLQESDPLPVFWGGKDVLGALENELSVEGFRSHEGVPAMKSTLGVALMSRLNLISHEARLLPGRGFVKLPHYGYTRTVFELPTSKLPLYVINVHAVYKNWTIGNFTELSTIQLQEIADVTNNVTHQQAPVIVLGDFNLNPEERQLDALWTTAGLKCVYHKTRSMLNESTLLNRFGNVDHIFYRNLNLIEGRIVTEAGRVSDHYPVLADFVMPT